MNSSASLANENELVCIPRPPLKHNMQKRRNFMLGDAQICAEVKKHSHKYKYESNFGSKIKAINLNMNSVEIKT